MKNQIIIIFISLVMLLLFFNVGEFIPNEKSRDIKIDDNALRKEALSHGLAAIPTKWKDAKKNCKY